MDELLNQNQALTAIITAVVTCLATALGTWWIARINEARTNKILEEQLGQAKLERENLKKENHTLKIEKKTLEGHMAQLRKSEAKLQEVRGKLKASSVVKTYQQPVVLVGPREVGKTSLLMQWHAPWVISILERTTRQKTSEVPVYDFVQDVREPHFADPELLVPVHIHLVLKIHDFPGELTAQKLIRNIIVQETQTLQSQTNLNLGVVLVCMFDAEEARTGLSRKTREYYSGELFRELRSLVGYSQIHIERLILVFNKYDELKKHYPGSNDKELLRLCIDTFDPVYNLLYGACNRDRVCEVFTILSREEMHFKNRGAPIVKGEAARAFVRAFAGRDAEKKIIDKPATTHAAERWQI